MEETFLMIFKTIIIVLAMVATVATGKIIQNRMALEGVLWKGRGKAGIQAYPILGLLVWLISIIAAVIVFKMSTEAQYSIIVCLIWSGFMYYLAENMKHKTYLDEYGVVPGLKEMDSAVDWQQIVDIKQEQNAKYIKFVLTYTKANEPLKERYHRINIFVDNAQKSHFEEVINSKWRNDEKNKATLDT